MLVTAPTFSEYEKACRISNRSKVKSYALKKEDDFDIDPYEFIAHMKGAMDSEVKCDMAFLCNPNNPTGRLLGKSEVLKIADAARELKCYLVVDEAFIDFCSKVSVIREVEENPYLIVLRSMTKFYALSGLRIGFGVFPQSIATLLKKYKEPWTVNTLAQEAVRASLGDTAYRKETLEMMKGEKKFMEKNFKRMSVCYVPSKANYYLLRIGNAQGIIPALEQKGILVRDCSNFNGLDDTYIRIAVRSRRENEILVKELSALCQAS